MNIIEIIRAAVARKIYIIEYYGWEAGHYNNQRWIPTQVIKKEIRGSDKKRMKKLAKFYGVRLKEECIELRQEIVLDKKILKMTYMNFLGC